MAVRGNRIEAVGPAAELASRFPGARRLDASGRIVMPGLINAHTHVPMTLFRGVADDLDLTGFLYGRIFPAEARFVDEEFVRWGTRLACLELLKGGVTTFVDMYYFEDAIAEEAARCGMRAVVGETLIDFPAPDNKTWADALAYMERFLARWHGHPLITPAVAPHATYTVSADHLREAHALAAKHDVPMLMHLAEARYEVEFVREKHGKGPVEYAASLGILDDRVVAAHMIFPSPAEIALLAERKVGVAHCPQSNMKGASGVAPVPALLAAGVAVGLGTDGAASNNDLSLWEEMDTAAKLAQGDDRRPEGAERPHRPGHGDAAGRRGRRPAAGDRVAGGGQARRPDPGAHRQPPPDPSLRPVLAAGLCDQGLRRGHGHHRRRGGDGGGSRPHGERGGGAGERWRRTSSASPPRTSSPASRADRRPRSDRRALTRLAEAPPRTCCTDPR